VTQTQTQIQKKKKVAPTPGKATPTTPKAAQPTSKVTPKAAQPPKATPKQESSSEDSSSEAKPAASKDKMVVEKSSSGSSGSSGSDSDDQVVTQTTKRKAEEHIDTPSTKKQKTDGGEEGNVKLFIRNLDFKITDPDLIDFFKDCGEVKDLNWIMRDGSFMGSGTFFLESAAAQKALAKDGQNLLNRPIHIQLSTPPEARNSPGGRGGRGRGDWGSDRSPGRGRGRGDRGGFDSGRGGRGRGDRGSSPGGGRGGRGRGNRGSRY